MNVDTTMCASSGGSPHWEQIDWPKCERNVRRLQARIVKATRQWARRRHPNKSAAWVKKQYFSAPGDRSWAFATDTGERTPEGGMIWKRLVYASDTKIKRHVKIRSDANPFDPQWMLTSRSVHSGRSSASVANKPESDRRETGSASAGLCIGLSRMKGNFHVRFLGERAVATPLAYPTRNGCPGCGEAKTVQTQFTLRP